MRRFLRLLLAPSVAVLALATAGCKQGEGERCQVSADCNGGLVCVLPAGGSAAEGGSCQKEGSIDASAPAADLTQLPATDGPDKVEDAAPGGDLASPADLTATGDGKAGDLKPSDMKPGDGGG